MASPYVSNFGLASITDATLTLTADGYAGRLIAVNRAAGCTITLPDATGSGNKYTITTIVDLSGDLVIQVPDADNVMQGVALTDMSGVIFATAATSDTVTMNGSTKGGKSGARVELIDVAANIWNVLVLSESSGTEATPFSAAVS